MNWIKYIITIPFALCVLFLQGLGKCFRLTYKQISVIFNLWIQGGALVISALLPFVVYVAMCCVPHGGDISGWSPVVVWILFFILLGYALMYLWFYVLMLRHYGKSFDWAFDKCVSDLQRIAHVWHCSYQCVNIVIFVGFFSILIGVNLTLTTFIMKMLM